MFDSLVFMYEKGGWVTIAILVCSVLSLAIFLERIWSTRNKYVLPEEFYNRLLLLIGENKTEEALAISRENKSAIANIAVAALSHLDNPNMEKYIETQGKNEAYELEKNISILGLVATISPLLGLLGTVTGMIRMFHQVAIRGIGDHRFVAAGIWEALITTAAGLIVAVPSYVGYRYLISRVDRKILRLEQESEKLKESIISRKRS
ncbi:MAG: MotA/TolQ/ExbB proton channel family protein [Deltaproteobacteria bacterium]|nr:MotA/TolQ/ExbB proton channel family protein [Deltaproteobacteria bacterium]